MEITTLSHWESYGRYNYQAKTSEMSYKEEEREAVEELRNLHKQGRNTDVKGASVTETMPCVDELRQSPRLKKLEARVESGKIS